MRLFQNGIFLTCLLFIIGICVLVGTIYGKPDGIFLTLFLFFLSLFFLFMAPRGSWIAMHLRFKKFVANSGPFETTEAAWEAFKKQDAVADDPLFRRWLALVDAKSARETETEQKS